MQFLLLIYIDEALIQDVPAEEYDAMMRGCIQHADKLKAEGTLVASQQLEPVAQARTLRTRQSQARITDGPFAETRELLAGFNLINARDQGFPWSRYGSIEVRPVADFEAERRRVGA